jgi:hypothetical protein
MYKERVPEGFFIRYLCKLCCPVKKRGIVSNSLGCDPTLRPVFTGNRQNLILIKKIVRCERILIYVTLITLQKSYNDERPPRGES